VAPAKSGGPGRGAETCLWKSLKRRSFAVCGFYGRVEFGAWQKQKKKRIPEKKLWFGGSRMGGVVSCDQSRSHNGNPG
jgi:hypothetical protein